MTDSERQKIKKEDLKEGQFFMLKSREGQNPMVVFATFWGSEFEWAGNISTTCSLIVTQTAIIYESNYGFSDYAFDIYSLDINQPDLKEIMIREIRGLNRGRVSPVVEGLFRQVYPIGLDFLENVH